MELFWNNGDYVPDGAGGFERAEGQRDLLQRVLFCLTVRRGMFPLDPELGSQLFRLPAKKTAERAGLAKEYVTEALQREKELTVTDVVWNETGGSGRLNVDLSYRGTPMQVTVEIGGG